MAVTEEEIKKFIDKEILDRFSSFDDLLAINARLNKSQLELTQKLIDVLAGKEKIVVQMMPETDKLIQDLIDLQNKFGYSRFVMSFNSFVECLESYKFADIYYISYDYDIAPGDTQTIEIDVPGSPYNFCVHSWYVVDTNKYDSLLFNAYRRIGSSTAERELIYGADYLSKVNTNFKMHYPVCEPRAEYYFTIQNTESTGGDTIWFKLILKCYVVRKETYEILKQSYLDRLVNYMVEVSGQPLQSPSGR